jgi:NADH:ubiquinone oxidoreductase subunit 2 (subunit N)
MVLLYAGATIATVFLVMAGHPDAVGYLASLFVLSSFASRSMLWLRVMALLSNAAFMLYAYDSHLPPVLFLHALLLPVNLVRLWQHSRATPGSA